jgi:tetratricopeptide (TPR) repeat protein
MIPQVNFSQRVGLKAAFLILIGVALAYGNSLRGPFVFDDVPSILENPSIRKLWPLSEVLWSKQVGGLTASGRPVLNLSLALNWAVSGENVWSYHLFNVLVHAGAGLLLFGIVRRTLRRPLLSARFAEAADALALVIALLWVLHPLQTQAVTYTVQRAESLMGFFYLLTFYAFVRGVEAHADRRWLWASLGACLLGMATKEVTATVPLLIALYDRTFIAGTWRAAWKERRGFYIGLALTWVVVAGLIMSTGGNRGGTVGLGVGVPWWAYGLTQFQAVTRYLGLAFWPNSLVFEYGTFWVQRASDVLPYAIVLLPLLAGTVVALRRWPAVGFAGAWFFVILAPTSLTPGTIQMIVEHRMYLPLAAVIGMAVLAVYAGLGRRAFWIFAAAIVMVTVLTAQRNADYETALTLWNDTVAKKPDNVRARQNLADVLLKAGRVNEAIVEYAATVRLKPDEPKLHYNLALALAQAGRNEEAVLRYEMALKLSPNDADVHNNLAVVLGQLGQRELAAQHTEIAVRLKPNNAQLQFNHALNLQRLGRIAEAIVGYEGVLRLQPERADAHANLATALAQRQRLSEALWHYAEAVRLQPDEVETRINFGNALLLAERAEAARGEFKTVLAMHPSEAAALYGLGNAESQAGRVTEAIAAYEAALRVRPDLADAQVKLGNVLMQATERVAEAVTHYEAALRLRPEDAEVHHNLGVAFARLERWPEAERELAAALRLQPNFPEAQRHLDQVRVITGARAR